MHEYWLIVTAQIDSTGKSSCRLSQHGSEVAPGDGCLSPSPSSDHSAAHDARGPCDGLRFVLHEGVTWREPVERTPDVSPKLGNFLLWEMTLGVQLFLATIGQFIKELWENHRKPVADRKEVGSDRFPCMHD